MQFYFTKSASGYIAAFETDQAETIDLLMYDVRGRIVFQKKIHLASGDSSFDLTAPGKGIYLVTIKGNFTSHSEKLLF
ncbi:MAG: T9SS type A sorting domain-containing protein [Chitinophagales bacterium]|nr:T9SS type A sorting domain-containing protein [Chitinophagales bacterium]